METDSPDPPYERWVVNKSSRILSPDEQSLLARGMNFAVAPSKIPVVDLIVSVESTVRKLDKSDTEQVRSEAAKIIGSSHPPKSNLSKGEQIALKALRRDDNIVILPADKGRCTVVMDTVAYHDKANSLLIDRNTYTIVKKDPTRKYKEQLEKMVKRLLDQDKILLVKLTIEHGAQVIWPT